jgi:hypothetical protein
MRPRKGKSGVSSIDADRTGFLTRTSVRSSRVVSRSLRLRGECVNGVTYGECRMDGMRGIGYVSTEMRADALGARCDRSNTTAAPGTMSRASCGCARSPPRLLQSRLYRLCRDVNRLSSTVKTARLVVPYATAPVRATYSRPVAGPEARGRHLAASQVIPMHSTRVAAPAVAAR